MSKKQAIMKKIGGLLAAVLVTTAVLPMGMVTAKADGLSFDDGKLKLTEIVVSGLPDGYSVEDISVSHRFYGWDDGHYHAACEIKFTLNREIEQAFEGHVSYRWSYDDGTYHSYQSDQGCQLDNAEIRGYETDDYVNHFLSFWVWENEVKEEKKKSSSSSSSMSEEEKQREAARHFAPDESTMTSEQKAGWSVVSRDPVVPSPSTGAGTIIRNAYQGSMCRLAFQLTAPAGYALGHTYDMELATGAGGNAGLKVPQDLMKTGRKYVVAFVVPGGPSVATVPLTPDAGGNINFNTTLLGLPAGSNYAMAIMYADV